MYMDWIWMFGCEYLEEKSLQFIVIPRHSVQNEQHMNKTSNMSRTLIKS